MKLQKRHISVTFSRVYILLSPFFLKKNSRNKYTSNGIISNIPHYLYHCSGTHNNNHSIIDSLWPPNTCGRRFRGHVDRNNKIYAFTARGRFLRLENWSEFSGTIPPLNHQWSTDWQTNYSIYFQYLKRVY